MHDAHPRKGPRPVSIAERVKQAGGDIAEGSDHRAGLTGEGGSRAAWGAVQGVELGISNEAAPGISQAGPGQGRGEPPCKTTCIF